MQSFKTGHRSDSRQRQHRSGSDTSYPKNQNRNEPLPVSTVGAEGAVRVTNIKLMLTKVNGDLAALSAAVQVNLPRLQRLVEGQGDIGSELATHIEETLALDQGWLDRKHEASDISARTIDILHGKSEVDLEIRPSHPAQQGLENMATGTDSTSTSTSTPTSAAAMPGTPRGTDPLTVNDIRIGNLTLLTQARGAKSKLARILGVSESIVSFLFNKKKDFNNQFSKEFEKAIALPSKWMDTLHSAKDVPAETWAILEKSTIRAPRPLRISPNIAPKMKMKGMPGLRLTMRREPTDLERAEGLQEFTSKNPEARSAIVASPSIGAPVKVGTAKASSTAAPAVKPRRAHRAVAKPAVTAQMQRTLHLGTSARPAEPEGGSAPPEFRPTPNVPATSASSDTASLKSAPQPVVTRVTRAKRTILPPTVVPAPAPAAVPTTETAATETQAGALQPSWVPPTSPTPGLPADALALMPITDALIKTLTLMAHDGRFTEKDAYRILGGITSY